MVSTASRQRAMKNSFYNKESLHQLALAFLCTLVITVLQVARALSPENGFVLPKDQQHH